MAQPHPAIRGLYAVTDGPRVDLVDACAAAIEGGAALLQYRDKAGDDVRRLREARALQTLCVDHGVPLIVNDDIELARRVGAAGVHLGEHDASPARARARLGEHALIGVSCYDSIERARAFAADPARVDYLAFGAFFASPTKPAARRATPALLQEARAFGLPLVAIGGIDAGNARELVDAGADALAVVSALFGARDVRAAARRIASLFEPRGS
ncbi:MAG: thiamine phosphate synthase [Lysobacteraceae bacterium]|nr:MAG: thiamine phosphate synthase [Xanthomonadaceae bacterium]